MSGPLVTLLRIEINSEEEKAKRFEDNPSKVAEEEFLQISFHLKNLANIAIGSSFS